MCCPLFVLSMNLTADQFLHMAPFNYSSEAIVSTNTLLQLYFALSAQYKQANMLKYDDYGKH